MYAKPSTSVSASFPTNSYDEFVSYDKNGNIWSVFRTGDLDSALDIFTIDNLTYTYDAGNRLMKVDDSTNHPQGFTDGNAGNDYAYDDFGNLVQDLNKGIYKSGNKGITYNHLNLPKEITFQNNPNKKITYLYNALGQKLEKKVTNGSTIITTEYQGGFQYEDEVLRFFATSEGYVSYDEQSEAFTYIYNYTDHLGNIRLSYKAGDRTEDPPAIVDENHYYPFGLKHTNYGFVPQQELAYAQKFNHREWQDEFNLNLTAMDFRQYDNALGRFYNPDRLAELAPGITPYRFAFNNPNYWADPTGLFETHAAALAYMNENNLTGTVYQGEDGLYHLVTDVFDYVMSNGELIISAVGGGIEITIGGTGGGSGGGSSSGGSGMGGFGGFGFGGNGGFFGFSASEVGAIATSGGLFAAALQDRATINQNYEYKYGTKTQSAEELTKLNKARMEKIAKGAKIGGHIAGGISLGVTYYQWNTGQISNTEASIDAIMGAIGFIPGWGTAISLTYFVGKGLYEHFSGETLFEKPN